MSVLHENSVRPEFDPASSAYRVHHDSDSHLNVSTTVVLAIASVTGDEPLEMLPLHRAVDSDALEYHVQSRDRDADLSFEFHGHHVTVRGDGRIEFAPLDDRAAGSGAEASDDGDASPRSGE